ncbi:hypothetical protein F383_32597 [Gossypium arboreum]|uniref:Uncharacterized protein n=1 Tax=Gossypium arboreum TaxID=29729 RepID=A0A0B0PHR2_GOSAR|nr:hypothetical protein F383_22919 [Gossypium arboreum]KHG26013.1 hypothetical protein F383_32597 [Gossypium arboreum]
MRASSSLVTWDFQNLPPSGLFRLISGLGLLGY